MAIDIYRSRRDRFHRCRWWPCEAASKADHSALVASAKPSGIFYAKDESQRARSDAAMAGAMVFEAAGVTLRTDDDVGALKPRDLVEFDGAVWRVRDMQQREVHRNAEMSGRPSVTTYMRLER